MKEVKLVGWFKVFVVIVVVMYAIMIYYVPFTTGTNPPFKTHTSISHTKKLTGYEACDRISYLMLAIGKKRNKGITIYTLFEAERSLPKNDIYITNILTKYAYAHPEYNPKELRLRSLQECDRIVFKSTHRRISKDVVI